MTEKKSNGNFNNIFKLKTLDRNIQHLIQEGIEARQFSYSPYSHFKVGSSLLCEDGTIYRGCNVENNSFTIGTCAERCAYFKAISDGKRKFKAIAIVACQEQFFTTPCGACRQFMSEFGNIDIYITKPNYDDVLVTTVNDLLPLQFQTIDHNFT